MRSKLIEARELGPKPSPREAATQLGNGQRSLAEETVPFCIWMASKSLTDYEQALWNAASSGGDMDTICAIVGGIVGARVGRKKIPFLLKQHREPLPDWEV